MVSDGDMDEPQPITVEHYLHPRYQMFWEVLESFSDAQISKYMQFVTGSSRVSKSVIAHSIFFDPMNDIIPRGHTCYNTIDLGVYTSADELKKKLLFAIDHSGFTENGFSNKKIHDDYDVSSPRHMPEMFPLRHTISNLIKEGPAVKSGFME